MDPIDKNELNPLVTPSLPYKKEQRILSTETDANFDKPPTDLFIKNQKNNLNGKKEIVSRNQPGLRIIISRQDLFTESTPRASNRYFDLMPLVDDIDLFSKYFTKAINELNKEMKESPHTTNTNRAN